jgi:hypothetical protein
VKLHYTRLKPHYTPLDHDAALQWAVDTFRRNAHIFPACHLALPLDVKYRRAGERESVELGYAEHSELVHDDEISAIVKNAHDGNKAAARFLSEIAARLVEQGDPLPAPLRQLISRTLRHPKRNRVGRTRFDLAERNQIVCFVVTIISLNWGFLPTRNAATEQAAAVSIAEEALRQVGIDLTESAIAKIWNSPDNHSWKSAALFRRRKETRAIK